MKDASKTLLGGGIAHVCDGMAPWTLSQSSSNQLASRIFCGDADKVLLGGSIAQISDGTP